VIRGIIRDLLGIYLGAVITIGYFSKNFTISLPVLVSAIVLLIFGIWFLLERLKIV
jgi:hypothetical protein